MAHGAGLRVSEVAALTVSDIDAQPMTLRVEQGKGRKDRYAMLTPVLLERLRTWWRLGHAQGKILPGGWLLPAMDPINWLHGSMNTRVAESHVPAYNPYAVVRLNDAVSGQGAPWTDR